MTEEEKQTLAPFWLGDLVSVRAVLGRRRGRYVRLDYTESEGIYAGWRTVSDGVPPDWDSYTGDYDGYRPSRFYAVAVVIVDPRRNPVYVLPDDLELLREGAMRTDTYEVVES